MRYNKQIFGRRNLQLKQQEKQSMHLGGITLVGETSNVNPSP
jgi:hypothetical protein